MTNRTVIGACLLGLVLTGCAADEPAPVPLPPVASASPSPTALPVPPEAMLETPQGAAAFTRHYLALLNDAFASMNASTVRAVSDAGCGTCTNLIGAIEEEPDPGERIEGGDYEVIFAESPPIEDGDVIVDLRYSLTEVRVFGTDGTVIETVPARPNINAQMRLTRAGSSWKVAGFRTVEGP